MFNLNSKKGMTLIEIVGVVLIIALIAMFAVPKVIEKYRDAQATKIVNDAKTIEDALDILEMKYYADKKVKGNYGLGGKEEDFVKVTDDEVEKVLSKIKGNDTDIKITENPEKYELKGEEWLDKEIDSISEKYENFFVVRTPADKEGKTHRVFHKKGVKNGSDEMVYGVHKPIPIEKD